MIIKLSGFSWQSENQYFLISLIAIESNFHTELFLVRNLNKILKIATLSFIQMIIIIPLGCYRFRIDDDRQQSTETLIFSFLSSPAPAPVDVFCARAHTCLVSDRSGSSAMEVIEMNNNNITSTEQYLRELTKTFVGIEKPLKNVKSVNSLQDLCIELHRVFDSDHVDIEYVNHLMLSYKSNPSDWKKFAKFDRYRQVK